MKTLFLVAVTAAALAAASAGPTAQQPRSTELDAVLFVKDLMVPMRDGVKLADRHLPARARRRPRQPAKLPLLLQPHAVRQDRAALVEQAKFFARHGYVVALQDDRGTYDSEGVQTKYIGYG